MELWEQSGESTAYVVNSLAGKAVKPGDLGTEPEKPGKHCYEWLGGGGSWISKYQQWQEAWRFKGWVAGYSRDRIW